MSSELILKEVSAGFLDTALLHDSFYLALAQLEGRPLWTRDRRLYNAVQNQLEWVHVLGES